MPKIIENVREKIIEVAYNLFIQDGYEQVKTGKIAKECGIAAGTLFNYFPTKWDLLREILDKVKDYGLKEFLDEIEDKPCGYERIYLAVTGMFYVIDKIGKLGKDFFVYMLSLDDTDLNQWKKKDPKTEKALTEALVKCLPEASEFSDKEITLLIKSFQALIFVNYTPAEEEQEERMHFICRAFMAMIKDSRIYYKEV